MKKIRKFPRIATSILLIAICVGTAVSAVPLMGQGSDTQDKIRLMSSALRARDAGNLTEAKAKLEELIKMSPNDATVARLLNAVNKDIEFKDEGKAAVYGQAAEVENFDPQNATEVMPPLESVADVGEASGLALDKLLDSAVNKQKKLVEEAQAAMQDASKLYKAERYDEAIERLVAAKLKLPASRVTASTLKDLDDAIGDNILAKVEQALADRDFETADNIAAAYRSQGGFPEITRTIENAIQRVKDDPWNQDVNMLSPGFLERQETVDKLLVKARAQMLYGDLNGASRTLSEIEARDPYNAAAKSLQLKIAELRSPASKLDHYKTRKEMLQEVERNWQRPKVFELTEQEVEDGGEDIGVVEKLRAIKVPEFRVSNSPLSRVLDTLSGLSEEFDPTPEKLGVNMIKQGGDDPTVTIRLRNLNMEQVLNFVAKQVGFSWEPQDGVVVFEKTGKDIFMETEFFPINTNVVTRLIGFQDGNDTAAAPADPFAPIATNTGGGGPSSTDKEDAIKGFFERAGIPFDPPATLAYDGTNLIVTQTPKNLEKLNNILRRYNQPKQVEIEAKFLEVQQGALEELGVQWSVNDRGSNRRSFYTPNTSRTLAGTFGADIQNSQIEITRSSGALDPTPFLPPVIPSQIDVGSGVVNTFDADGSVEGQGSLGAIQGVINGADVDVIINALSRKEGSDLMSSPRVTVLSGRTAQITVAQELRYPENYGDIESQVSSAESGSGGSSVAITAGTPQDFTVRMVGVEMEVTPNVEENDNISLKLEPKVTEFEGFVEYGGPSVAIASDTTVTVPSGFFQPVFGVRTVRTEVVVYDGATVVIGGLTREEIKTVEDKVPVLGDIPLLGRLFRSEGETSLKRNLLIFVTANLISPGGSVSSDAQNLPIRANSQFRNPIVVTPGGGVNREVSE